MPHFENKKSPFILAQLGSLGLAMLIFIFSLLVGRDTVFLAWNEDLGVLADQFFRFFTNLAEGWIWIPYLLVVFGLYKKDLVFILLNFLTSTLLTQLPKNFIWPNVNRPIASGIEVSKIHTVAGVEVHTYNSFPSGHTTTAFILFFLTIYFFQNKKVFWIGTVYDFD